MSKMYSVDSKFTFSKGFSHWKNSDVFVSVVVKFLWPSGRKRKWCRIVSRGWNSSSFCPLPPSTERSEVRVGHKPGSWQEMGVMLQVGHMHVLKVSLWIFSVAEPSGDNKNNWTEEAFCKRKDLKACRATGLANLRSWPGRFELLNATSPRQTLIIPRPPAVLHQPSNYAPEGLKHSICCGYLKGFWVSLWSKGTKRGLELTSSPRALRLLSAATGRSAPAAETQINSPASNCFQ